MSHYFGLAHSFWAMCFIANTYAVIVRDNRAVFKHPIKIHFIQSVFCWLVPAVIVTCCLYISPPGYKFLFIDLMAAGAASARMAYFAVTLPMQVTLGVSLCLLWSIVWHLRKVRTVRIFYWWNSWPKLECMLLLYDMGKSIAPIRVYLGIKLSPIPFTSENGMSPLG